jgi:membrane protein implicated in regulation of membrane protease activity
MDWGNLFLTVLGGSFLFFVISLIFGMEHGDMGGHDSGGHDGGEGGFATDLFTLRNIFLFGVGYGALGFIARYLGAGPLGSNLWGCLAGAIMAFFGAWLFRALKSQQSNTITNLDTLIGKSANVITAIPEGGRGEIETANAFGTRVHMPAQSSDGAIAEHTTVEIVNIVGNTATVKTAL